MAKYVITLHVNNDSMGSVTELDEEGYEEGTSLSITATPAEGFIFSHWSDNNENATRTIVVSEDKEFKAYFRRSASNYKKVLASLANLTRFWTRLKEWFASNDAEKGASAIGIHDAGGLYSSNTVEGALAEVKNAQNALTTRVSGNEGTMGGLLGKPLGYYVSVPTSGRTYEIVVQGNSWDSIKEYYQQAGSSYQRIYPDNNFMSAAGVTTYGDTVKFYYLNPMTLERTLWTPDPTKIATAQEQFDEAKESLQFIPEWNTWIENGLFTASGGDGRWKMTASGIIMIQSTYNGWIHTKVTGSDGIAREQHFSHRDKYGQGNICHTIFAPKGATVEITGGIEKIYVAYFTD